MLAEVPQSKNEKLLNMEKDMKKELIEALDMAQCELRAIYKRLGFLGSNVLDKVNAALAKINSEPDEAGAVGKNEQTKKFEFRCGEGDNRCNCDSPDDCGYLYIAKEAAKLK